MADDLKSKGASATQPAKVERDLQAIVEQQAKELAELRSILMATIQSQPKVTPDSLWAQNHQKEMKIKEELDRMAALFLESSTSRSQWDANKINPDGRRLFKISVGWCPELVIRANDEIAARAYYDKVCGISGVTTNHKKPETTTYNIADVTSDPAAQALAKSEWQEKAAA